MGEHHLPMTDTNIVERVARALANRHYSARFSLPENQGLVDRNVNANWPAFAGDARAAIAAMREPSDAMVAAGHSALSDGDGGPADAADCHRAMIDAALEASAGKEE